MNQRQKPLIGIIMGDPAGIGPEITIRSVLSPEILTSCQPIVIGDARILRGAFQVQPAEGKIHIQQPIPVTDFVVRHKFALKARDLIGLIIVDR